MKWQASKSRPPLSDDILFLPASAKTVSQAEIDALEAKRIRRLRELGNWRPSRGWHIEPKLPPAAALEAADEASRVAARALLRDAELQLLNAGHFALETHGPEIGSLMRHFLDRRMPRAGPQDRPR